MTSSIIINDVIVLNDSREAINLASLVIGKDSTTEKLEVSNGDAIIHDLRVGRGPGNLNTNTVLGYNSFIGNQTGINNIVVGDNALKQNSAGSRNIGIGSNALATTTASDNIGIGNNSLTNVSNGTRNISIGTDSLKLCLGSDNIGIGYEAGATLTAGSNNILIGRGSSPSSNSISNEITLGNNSINKLRIPGIQLTIENQKLSFNGILSSTSYEENYVILNSPVIDCKTGTIFQYTLSSSITFSVNNVPAAGKAYGFLLIISSTGTYNINWMSGVKWINGIIPDTPTSGTTNIYSFFTGNNGTTWYGFLVGEDMS